jgi:hypothetical protein
MRSLVHSQLDKVCDADEANDRGSAVQMPQIDQRVTRLSIDVAGHYPEVELCSNTHFFAAESLVNQELFEAF